MIDTIYLEIIILMFSVNIFEGKIFPQTLNMFLAMAMMIAQIQATAIADMQSMIGIFVLYGAVVLYAGLQIYSQKPHDGE